MAIADDIQATESVIVLLLVGAVVYILYEIIYKPLVELGKVVGASGQAEADAAAQAAAQAQQEGSSTTGTGAAGSDPFAVNTVGG